MSVCRCWHWEHNFWAIYTKAMPSISSAMKLPTNTIEWHSPYAQFLSALVDVIGCDLLTYFLFFYRINWNINFFVHNTNKLINPWNASMVHKMLVHNINKFIHARMVNAFASGCRFVIWRKDILNPNTRRKPIDSD